MLGEMFSGHGPEIYARNLRMSRILNVPLTHRVAPVPQEGRSESPKRTVVRTWCEQPRTPRTSVFNSRDTEGTGRCPPCAVSDLRRPARAGRSDSTEAPITT